MTDDRPLGFGPQGFALEFNPWQTRRSVERAILCRGAIVAGWANVEATLIEIAIRASYHPSYLGHRPAYPSKVKSRITYLSEIIQLDGPLRRHAVLGKAILDRYASAEDLRNMMAHARMEVLPNWGMTLHFFQAKSQGEIRYQTRRFAEPELEELAQKAARFSRAVRRLVARLDQEHLLPPLSVAE